MQLHLPPDEIFFRHVVARNLDILYDKKRIVRALRAERSKRHDQQKKYVCSEFQIRFLSLKNAFSIVGHILKPSSAL
jgi:hypothetical protein